MRPVPPMVVTGHEATDRMFRAILAWLRDLNVGATNVTQIINNTTSNTTVTTTIIGNQVYVVDYRASGTEGTDFFVPIGTSITGAYAILQANAGVIGVPLVDLPSAGSTNRQATQFRVIVNGALSHGDVLTFLLVLKT